MIFSRFMFPGTSVLKQAGSLTRSLFGIHNLAFHQSRNGNLCKEFSNRICISLKCNNRTSSCSMLFRYWEVPLISPLTAFVAVKTSSQSVIDEAVNHVLSSTRQVNCTSVSSSCYISYFLFQIWDFFLTLLRVIRLGCTFLPILVLSPLTYLGSTIANIWYTLLVYSLEFSGPIFIKLGQWASTRRDIFSAELCNNLARLQTKNRPHSWYYTRKTLERAFGDWQSVIKLESTIPVGSGCCGQVYKAWINPDAITVERRMGLDQVEDSCSSIVEVMEMVGINHILSTLTQPNYDSKKSNDGWSPVAMKVLHPRISTLLKKDLAIMKFMANLLTWTIPGLKWLSLPDCVDDFAKLMRSQVDLNLEAENLEKFAQNFKRVRSVHFPEPIRCLTTPYLLVETYEEGQSMQNIVTSSNAYKLKSTLAHIGIDIILKMVFDDNFIHGDLHPGNMLVQQLEQGDFEEAKSFDFWKHVIPTPKVRLTVLDCGIIVSLEEREKGLLRAVFTAVADGDGQTVAQLFLNNSTHQCTNPESFTKKISELVTLSVDKTLNLQSFAVSSLMSQLFQTLIQHKVKIDGCFSAVILAVMVVEGLGRSLDPNIDLVDKAKPYLFKDKLLSRL